MNKLLIALLIALLPLQLSATIIDNGGGGGGAGSDTTAIHYDTADEYSNVGEEATPESGDRVLVEDATTKAKEWVEVGNFPTGSGMASFDVSGNAGSAQTITNGNNISFVGADNIVTTASATDTITIGIDAATRTAISNSTTHITSDGSDHSFIDQDVTSGSSPTLDGTNFTGIPAGALDDTYWTDASSSTGTNKTINDFTNFVGADEVHKKIFNNTGSTLLKGTPVYVSGYNVGQDAVQVTKADADNSATMPAAYLIEADINTGSSGHGILAGTIASFDTSSYSVGDELYVSTTAGVLTATKPTGATAAVQKVAIVTRSHASLGRIEVFGAGRENDIPNQANFTGSVTANVLSDGTISITGGNLTGATGVTATNLTGTLATAAQTNITSLGTLTTLTVDNMTLNGNTINADTGALNLTPAAGSAIVLDGTINIDAGVLTGATAITATNLTGTLQTASQTNITGVGTITTGVWSGTALVDAKVDNDLTISGGTINNSVIGASTPLAGSFTTVDATQQIYAGVSHNVTTTNNITIDFNEGESHVIDLQSAGGDLDITLSNMVTGNTYLITFIQGAIEREWTTSNIDIAWINGTTPNMTATADAKTKVALEKLADGSVDGNYNDYY